LEQQSKPCKLKLGISKTFRFTCPLLDITYIHFDDDAVKTMCEKYNRTFLTIDFKWTGEDEEILGILQYPSGFDYELQFAKETDKNKHSRNGIDIYHYVSTRLGSSGSPVFVIKDKCSAKAIGIHKLGLDNRNVAVSAQALFEAFHKSKAFKLPLANKVIVNPTDSEICQALGIKKESSPHEGNQKKWFALTSHGWYWTSQQPTKKKYIKWEPVDKIGEEKK